jgi:hypothetical protein
MSAVAEFGAIPATRIPMALTLLSGWHVDFSYVMVGIGLALLVRVLMVLLRAFEKRPDQRYWRIVGILFLGKQSGSLVPDYWHPFILGLLELLAYPVLMVADRWEFIGAWMAFKTLAQWKTGQEGRVPFNRFLIGNALVVILALLVMVKWIHTSSPLAF